MPKMLGLHVLPPRTVERSQPPYRGGGTGCGLRLPPNEKPSKIFAGDQARSNWSRLITLLHAATKSFTNFPFESANP